MTRYDVKCPCGSFLPRPKDGREFVECKRCGNHYHVDDVDYSIEKGVEHGKQSSEPKPADGAQ